MMKPKTLIALLLMLFLSGNVWAQGFYTIYPIPHEQLNSSGKVSFTKTVSVVAEEGIDNYTRDRLQQILQEHGLNASFDKKAKSGLSTIYLGINGSKGQADRKATNLKLKRDVFNLQKYDRHVVSLSSAKGKAQLVVLGENTDAVFYGLATLEQMLDYGTKNLPCTVFYDYADVKDRGVIEGYYGVPYSVEVTEDLFRFMARYKLNTYMYGAKSDPYHSNYWDQPYPTKITENQTRLGLLTQDMMKRLCEVAHQSKVNFIWSIHPGQSFTDVASSDVIERIMSKFEIMYDLGVRQFGVFVDDVGVPDDEPTLRKGAERLTLLQERIDQRWNQPGAKPADMVKPLQYVPQLYAFSWVNEEKARKFWESLRPVPSNVNIYTTGKNIWSVPNSSDLNILNEYLGREVSWWWNYPCNDVDVTKIFVADTYSNFADEKHIDSKERLEKGLSLKTIIINPMQQGELSKIALFSTGDYTWNMDTFDNMQSWHASLLAIIGKERAQSFETIVPYLRYYDAHSPLAQLINDFKVSYEKEGESASIQPIQNELKRIGEACDVVATMANSENKSDSLFYADLRPWLSKLKAMTVHGDIMLSALVNNSQAKIDRVTFAKSWSAIEGMEKHEDHQFDILTGMGHDIALSVQTAEPAAQSLRPFLNWILEKLEQKK